ncbi:MAG: serine/threonine-protein kinase [Myxococcota bacterium]
MSSSGTDGTEDPLELYDALVMAGKAPGTAEFAAQYPDDVGLLEKIEALEVLRSELDAMVDHVADDRGERPTELGGYRLVELIGRGGMGEVFIGEPIDGGRRCAVKLLRRASPTAIKRFRREARLASGLLHPGIACVNDFGVEDGHAYLVVELVPGFSLKQMLAVSAERRQQPTRRGRHRDAVRQFVLGDDIPPAPRRLTRSVDLARQVAEALAHAHAHGVIHRDVKPSNIMVSFDGTTRLIDFGIALESDRDERITRTGVFIGSCDYAAPEQLRGDKKSIGPWTDTYALGATLFELLTHRTPFDGAALGPRIARAAERPPQGARQLNPKIPRALDTLVMRALHPSPKKRFRDGGRMAEAMRAWLAKAPADL